jgi:DNA-binding GntR family transcriptional regulator
MRLTPPHAPTKSEAAYQALLRAIRAGDLAPGQRVIIAEVAEQLGMSLTPVRDALALLAEQGLVVRRPNHMTVISEHTRERSAEVSMLRSLLEPQAAMLAAVRADPDALAAIGAACAAMDRAVAGGDGAGPGDANARFHQAVARAGGSEVLADFIDRLWKQIPLQGLTVTGQSAKAAREHREILVAIEAGDGEQARLLMAAHVGHAAAAAEAFLDEIRPRV